MLLLLPLAVLPLLMPSALAESSTDIRVESRSTVDTSVNGKSEHHETSQTEHWTNADAGTMRPYGAVMQGTSTDVRCINSACTTRASASAAPTAELWIDRCRTAIGTSSCDQNGSFARIMSRQARTSSARFERIFQRWLQRMQLRLR